jgi:hypothetical protein
MLRDPKNGRWQGEGKKKNPSKQAVLKPGFFCAFHQAEHAQTSLILSHFNLIFILENNPIL